MKAKAKERVPRWLRHRVRQARYLGLDTLDFWDKLAGRRDDLRPPRRLIIEVGGIFDEAGREILRVLKSVAGLKPAEQVLEIGCGVGRIALPLAQYLAPPGRYEGLDIVWEPVRWCQEHITPRHPNFRFLHCNIYNTSYNRTGQVKARDYVFPYPDSTFDLVFLTSVFTHMLPEDMGNYLKQCARVLRTGGRCLITFFLVNEEALRLLRSGKWTIAFPNEYRNYRTAFKDNPEAILAYDELFVRQRYAECGLEVVEPIYYGSWAGRSNHLSGQDIVLARKP
jgi:SAM-dependent methyltransferase